MSLPKGILAHHQMNPENWSANYREGLLRFAISKVSDYQAAEDLVQETFISAWKARQNFRGDCSEKTYLSGILRNKIIDFYRANGRKPTVVASQLQGDDDSADCFDWLTNALDSNHEEDPSMGTKRKEFRADLDTALESLSPKMANAFRLWMIEDRPTEEVTKELGISESNLWVSLFRAKKILKKELQDEWSALSLS